MGTGVPGVVIVDLDEESLARVGQWPWPRNTITDLVQNLMAYGAVAVGFDVFFVEEDLLSPAQFVKTVRNLDPAVAEVLNALPSNDVILAEMLRNSRTVFGQTALSTVTIGELPSVANPGTAGPKMDLPPEEFAISRMFNFAGAAGNNPVLDEAAPGHGMVTVAPEPDGVVRRVPMVLAVAGNIYDSLTVDMLRLAVGAQNYLIRYNERGIESVVLSAQFKIPTDDKGRIYVNFRPHDPDMYVPAADVLDAVAPVESIQGKFVLIGASAAGLQDIRRSPIDATLPGV